jgi:hypothetical protein
LYSRFCQPDIGTVFTAHCRDLNSATTSSTVVWLQPHPTRCLNSSPSIYYSARKPSNSTILHRRYQARRTAHGCDSHTFRTNMSCQVVPPPHPE